MIKMQKDFVRDYETSNISVHLSGSGFSKGLFERIKGKAPINNHSEKQRRMKVPRGSFKPGR